MVLFIYSTLRNCVGKTDCGDSGINMAVATQDGCCQVKLDLYNKAWLGLGRWWGNQTCSPKYFPLRKPAFSQSHGERAGEHWVRCKLWGRGNNSSCTGKWRQNSWHIPSPCLISPFFPENSHPSLQMKKPRPLGWPSSYHRKTAENSFHSAVTDLPWKYPSHHSESWPQSSDAPFLSVMTQGPSIPGMSAIFLRQE
jgi:hypothetical protein